MALEGVKPDEYVCLSDSHLYLLRVRELLERMMVLRLVGYIREPVR